MSFTVIPARKDAAVLHGPGVGGPCPVASSDCCKMVSGAGPTSLADVWRVIDRPVNGITPGDEQLTVRTLIAVTRRSKHGPLEFPLIRSSLHQPNVVEGRYCRPMTVRLLGSGQSVWLRG